MTLGAADINVLLPDIKQALLDKHSCSDSCGA